MFGSMHRVRRNRRNKVNLTVDYTPTISTRDYDEMYYRMYIKEVKKRRKLESRILDARKYVTSSDVIPIPAKKILQSLLKIR